VPNLDEATFARLAEDAERNCPVSKVLKAEITLDAKLVRPAALGDLELAPA
jgi:lipoyl-dependent peroxiredoxin